MEPVTTESQREGRSSSRFDRAVLLTAVATAALGLGMILALLADLQDRFGFPDWGLGVITASSFLTAFFAYIWLSPFADRGYARPMMILGGLVTAGAMLWIGFATELWQFTVARALVGLGEGMFVPAARRVALSWSDRPGRELGSVFSASIVGFLVGPGAGAIVADAFDLSAPFFIAAALMLLVLPFVARMTAPPGVTQSTPGGVLSLFRSRMVTAGVLLAATEFFSVGALEAVWARLLADNGASTTFIGVGFAIILAPLVVLAPVGGRLADRYRPLRVGVIAAALVVPLLLLYGWVTALVGLLVVGAVHASMSAAIAPSAGAAVAEGSPSDRIAQGQGLLEAFGFLAAAVAAAGAGLLYGALGASGLFISLTAGAAVLVVSAFLVGRPAIVSAKS